MTGSLCPGKNTSSSRLARLMNGMSVTPSAVTISMTEDSCPLPPSMTMRSGRAPRLSSSLPSLSSVSRLVSVSCKEAKSSLPSTVLMRNLRYAALSGSPLVNTTIDATLFVPLMCEMS